MDLGQRIKRVMKLRAMSARDLARKTGLATSTLYDILRGDHQPKHLHKFADALGVHIRYLETGKGPDLVEPAASILEGGHKGTPVPLCDVRGSMAPWSDAEEHLEIVHHMSINWDALRKVTRFSRTANLRFVTAYGNSMDPTFTDGDILLIDKGVTAVTSDAIYGLERDGELFIRRIQRLADGSLLMLSDNRLYAPQPIRKEDAPLYQCRGRVLLAWNVRKL